MDEIIKIVFDKNSMQLHLQINIVYTIIITVVFLLIMVILKQQFIKNRKNKIHKTIKPVELTFKTGNLNAKYIIERNFKNIEIAYKIYIELITRKAAIKIEKEKDVIIEIYDSWYELFKIIRKELKSFSGELIYENEKSGELITLIIDVLNLGLRPHLTEYQAKFRKWYLNKLLEEEEKEIKERRAPQEIQKEYPDYDKLINSLLSVNELLIEYSQNLKTIINTKL